MLNLARNYPFPKQIRTIRIMSLRPHPLLPTLLLFAACEIAIGATGVNSAQAAAADQAAPTAPAASPLRFQDVPAPPGPPFKASPVLQAQVELDRLGFSPGVIDGREGKNYAGAIRGFQAAHGLPQNGQLDDATRQALERQPIPATRLVRIPAAFAAGPFTPNIPKDATAQARLPSLQYRNVVEALAERFHTTPQTLKALNPANAKAGAGAVVRVPNVPDIDEAQLGPDDRGWNGTLERLGVAPDQPAAAKVVVDKSDGVLRAYDGNDRLIAQFPATMGSEHDPLPIGEWKIQGVSRNPEFHYNPKLFWDASAKDEAAVLKPGPNGPVGVVWIDLSKPHYGIHGTSEPSTIGRAESHGCVRLTNWDAARLAQMVKSGVPAIFQE